MGCGADLRSIAARMLERSAGGGGEPAGGVKDPDMGGGEDMRD